MTTDTGRRRGVALALALAAVLVALLMACSGPDTGDDTDPTATPTVTPTPTQVPPTMTSTPNPTATTTPQPPTPTPTRTPTQQASPTASGSPPVLDDLMIELPTLDALPGPGWTIAEDGTRSAQDLANAYADPGAHLKRLDEWGFKRHVFRAFTRTSSGSGDTIPFDFLATVNEYGSDDQADAALLWIRRLATSQGAVEADAPTLGDASYAATVSTADGTPTAYVYVREDALVYIFFAQGGDPLHAVHEVASHVHEH